MAAVGRRQRVQVGIVFAITFSYPSCLSLPAVFPTSKSPEPPSWGPSFQNMSKVSVVGKHREAWMPGSMVLKGPVV